MSQTIQPNELQALVSNAVALALKQRGITDKQVSDILHGPILVGLWQVDKSVIAKAPMLDAAAHPGVQLKQPPPHTLGFIANSIQELQDGLKKMG